MQFYADVCGRCSKKVVKRDRSGSSDMVQTCDSFLYLCDCKPGETSRPSLCLKDHGTSSPERTYCLDCLVLVVGEWVKKMKERGYSKIPLSNIIYGELISSPCPVCGK